MILLDTNVISELMRRQASPLVVKWVEQCSDSRLCIPSITQAEIFYGIELLPKGKRRNELLAAAEAMFAEDFSGRILPFDSAAARLFGKIAAARRTKGRPISQSDAQIAAIAQAHGTALATRNLADFEGCGIDLIDPWAEG